VIRPKEAHAPLLQSCGRSYMRVRRLAAYSPYVIVIGPKEQLRTSLMLPRRTASEHGALYPGRSSSIRSKCF